MENLVLNFLSLDIDIKFYDFSTTKLANICHFDIFRVLINLLNFRSCIPVHKRYNLAIQN